MLFRWIKRLKRKAHFQQTFAAQASFEKYVRKSRRELFLDEMNAVAPWSRQLGLVEMHYTKAAWSSASWIVDHTANRLFAAVVQSVGSWHGRSALRVAGAAALPGSGSWRGPGSG